MVRSGCVAAVFFMAVMLLLTHPHPGLPLEGEGVGLRAEWCATWQGGVSTKFQKCR